MIKILLFYQLMVINVFCESKQLNFSYSRVQKSILINRIYIITKYLFFKKYLHYDKLMNVSIFLMGISSFEFFLIIMLFKNNAINKIRKIFFLIILITLNIFSFFLLISSVDLKISYYDKGPNYLFDKNISFENILYEQILFFKNKESIISKIYYIFYRFYNMTSLFLVNFINRISLNYSKNAINLIERKKQYIINTQSVYVSMLSNEYEDLKTNIFISKKNYTSIKLFYKNIIFCNILLSIFPFDYNNYLYYFLCLIIVKFFLGLYFCFMVLFNINFNGLNSFYKLFDWLFVDIMFFLYENPKIYNVLIKNPKFVKYVDIKYDEDQNSYILFVKNQIFFKSNKIVNLIQQEN